MVPLLFLIRHVQINSQSAPVSHWTIVLIFLLGAEKHTKKVASIIVTQDCLHTHPTSLSNPVAQPPVTEGYAACGEEEEQDVDDEDYWTSCCFDVGSIHRPVDCAGALLFSCHQLFYINKEGEYTVTCEPFSRKNKHLAFILHVEHKKLSGSLTSFLTLSLWSDLGDIDSIVCLSCTGPPLFVF